MLQFLIVLAILALVVIVVTGPLRSASRSRSTGAAGGSEVDDNADIADLEAAREAKYREIRDAELDHSTGKLSDADYEAVDKTLRAEAVEILHALDRAREA
jgi:hypothetical protein